MKALPANRVILILGIIYTAASAAAVFVAGVTNSLPKAWAPAVTVIVVVLGAVAAVTAKVITFLKGSQKVDAQHANLLIAKLNPANMQASSSGQVEQAGATPTGNTEVVSVDRLPLDALHNPNLFNSDAAGFPDPGEQEPAPEPHGNEVAQG